MSEATPPAPCARKGEIRARLHAALEAAGARGDVRWAAGRASDFFGPGAWDGSFLGARFWPAALAGKRAQLPIVDLDTAHTYHFTHDVAAALATLGLDPTADGLWMLPCAPAVTTRGLVDRCAEALGRPIAVARTPRLALRALGLVVPIVRELAEMAYQWEEPFVVDDRRWRARFGDGAATSLPAAAAATVAWAQERTARKA
jgi:nucleoside-diphosphate-sugar epimerase